MSTAGRDADAMSAYPAAAPDSMIALYPGENPGKNVAQFRGEPKPVYRPAGKRVPACRDGVYRPAGTAGPPEGSPVRQMH